MGQALFVCLYQVLVDGNLLLYCESLDPAKSVSGELLLQFCVEEIEGRARCVSEPAQNDLKLLNKGHLSSKSEGLDRCLR